MMRKGLLTASGVALAAIVATGSARADEPTAPVLGERAAPLAPADHVTEKESPTVPWTTPVGTGVSLSYENGLWGSAWAQGLRIKIPFHPRWGMVMRPLVLQHVEGGDPYRADLGGRVELYGASPVFLNFARIYGGGGPQVFYAVTGLTGSKPVVGGGGHFGFEFFLNQHASFFAEIGGTSGAQGGLGTGGTVMAGMTWYPWSSSAPATVVASASSAK